MFPSRWGICVQLVTTLASHVSNIFIMFCMTLYIFVFASWYIQCSCCCSFMLEFGTFQRQINAVSLHHTSFKVYHTFSLLNSWINMMMSFSELVSTGIWCTSLCRTTVMIALYSGNTFSAWAIWVFSKIHALEDWVIFPIWAVWLGGYIGFVYKYSDNIMTTTT